MVSKKKCIFCDEDIDEDSEKLSGTVVKATDEHKKNQFIYVCSDCQRKENWIEKSKIKGA